MIRDTMRRDDDFAKLAESRRTGFMGELWGFMRSNKKWWLGPIIVVMLLVGVLIVVVGTGVTSFIYTLF